MSKIVSVEDVEKIEKLCEFLTKDIHKLLKE